MKPNKIVLIIISSCLFVSIFYLGLNSNNLTKEETLYNLYKNIEAKPAVMDEIIRLLPDIDWSAYDSLSNNGSFILLKKLCEYDFQKHEHILATLKATKNLDGVVAEQYSYLLFYIFNQNKYEFINSLALLNKEQYTTAIEYLYYQFECLDNEQKEKLISDLTSIRLGEDEKKLESIVNEIIVKLESQNSI